MALNFPRNPESGDFYSFNNTSYIFDGVAWGIYRPPEEAGSAVQEIDNLGMVSDLETRTENELDDPDLGIIKTLSMLGGFVGSRSDNPTIGGDRAPWDLNFSGTVTASDQSYAIRPVVKGQTITGRFSLECAWGTEPCGIGFQGPTAYDTIKYAVGRSDYAYDPFMTNAMIVGYKTGPRVVLQKNHLANGTAEFADPIGQTLTERTDVITVVGDTDVLGTLKVSEGATVTGTVDLGSIADIKISGGASGQVITTDGNGNLTFSDASGGTNQAATLIYSMIFGAT